MRIQGWAFFGLLAALSIVACGSSGGVSASSPSAGGSGGGVLTGVGGGGVSGSSTTAMTTTGTNASAATTSTAGAGGGGLACPPTPPIEGPGITGPDHQWTWVPVTGSRCLDGSGTGIGLRMSSTSTKLYIYLEGGGACFNAATCAISLGAFGQTAFDAWAGTVGQTGIFDTSQSENPVRDWNAIYVPYCSGDVHAGDAAGRDVPGGPQGEDFLGYENVGLYLQRILPTFAGASEVLLAGASAGGFGAALNYDRVAAAFCPLPVTLLDDSGPPMSDTYLAPCLQKQWRGLWDLAATLPAGCADCTEADGGGIVNYVTYLAGRWPNSHMGLVSSTEDAVISTFFGFGADDCTSSTPLPGATYAAGLEELRTKYLSPSGRWGTYFVASITHTYLLGPGFYATTVNGKPLTEWVGDLLDGQAGDIGP